MPKNDRSELCDCRMIHQESIDRAREQALPDETVEGLAALFKGLADPGRVRILHALRRGEMCVCDLAAFLGVSESAVSHQLRMLRQLRLVANRRDGAVLYYRLRDGIVERLFSLGMEFV